MPARFSRDVVKARYALFSPDGFASSALAGWNDTTIHTVISPRLGSNFFQKILTLKKNGHGENNTGNSELFAYVIEGSCTAKIGGKSRSLPAGHYVFVPPKSEYGFASSQDNTRLLFFEKRYEPLTAHPAPAAIFGDAARIQPAALFGNSAVLMQSLLEDASVGADMAVDIVTFQPGAATPSVECSPSEQGLLMLSGGGIFRLDSEWHPVQAGDVLWIAPHCPRWFAAIGDIPASYVYYRDL